MSEDAHEILNEWNDVGAKGFDSVELDKSVKELRILGNEYDALEAQKKEVGKRYSDLEGKILKILTDAKKSSYRVDDVGLVSVRNKLVVRIPATLEDQRAFKQWCLDKYGQEFVDSNFKMLSQSLTAFYNKEVENSKDANFSIPGIAAPSSVQTLSFTKERK